MRRVFSMCAILLAVSLLGVVWNVVIPPKAAQAEIQKASQQLTKTEGKLAGAVADTNGVVESMGKAMDNIDAPGQLTNLSKDLRELQKKAVSLRSLRDSLEQDITAFENVRVAKMAAVNDQAKAIKDQWVQRRIHRMRDEVYSESGRQLSAAREALADMDKVLQEADDVALVSGAITGIEELRTDTQEFGAQIQRGKTAANEFARTSSNLLARLASVRGDERAAAD
jgi:chromosome segregation ATPase